MTQANPLVYNAVSNETKDYIKSIPKNKTVENHIDDLYKIINYQIKEIMQLNSKIISYKHQEAWKRYDRPIHEYDTSIRKYLSEDETKNRSC